MCIKYVVERGEKIGVRAQDVVLVVHHEGTKITIKKQKKLTWCEADHMDTSVSFLLHHDVKISSSP